MNKRTLETAIRRGKHKTVQEETERKRKNQKYYLGKSDPMKAKGKEF